MAIFSIRHSVKTFSPKCENAGRIAARGQTAAHLRYITRKGAARVVIRKRLEGSTDSEQARLCEVAAEKRKGRVCERFIVALPVEASSEQRVALAREFAELLTGGVAGYVLAIHDKSGNDRFNPHFHLAAFDRHLSSGGKGRPRSVIGMARKNAVEKRAEQWATLHNRMMLEWGYDPLCEISHLSYAIRGIDRIPEIHEGPAARHMSQQAKRHEVKPEWNHVDAGRSRHEANVIIREINKMKKEDKYAPTHRLGKGSSRDAIGRDDSGKSLGADNRRYCGNSFPPTRAADHQFSCKIQTCKDRQPPWRAGGDTAHRKTLPRQLPFASQAKHPGVFVDARWGSNRRSIRRVFHELMMLRETLRARLASRNGRRRTLPSSETVRMDGQNWLAKDQIRKSPPEASTEHAR